MVIGMNEDGLDFQTVSKGHALIHSCGGSGHVEDLQDGGSDGSLIDPVFSSNVVCYDSTLSVGRTSQRNGGSSTRDVICDFSCITCCEDVGVVGS